MQEEGGYQQTNPHFINSKCSNRGKFVPRPAFPAVNQALSKWKELNSPRMIKRDPMNIPAGI